MSSPPTAATLFNTFTPHLSSIGTTVTGNFYDMKNSVKFNVNMDVSANYVVDRFDVFIDLANKNTATKLTTVSIPPRKENSYTIPDMYITHINDTSGSIRFPFANHETYKILYKVFFRLKSVNPENANLIVTNHIQLFKYYSTPVTFKTNFIVPNDIDEGDDINIANLFLNNTDGSGNILDTTTPHWLTFTFQDNDAEPGDTGDENEVDSTYAIRKPYNSSGSYILPQNTLTNGSTYTMTIIGTYLLGYETSITYNNLLIFDRPNITSVDKLELYTQNNNDNVVTITLSDALEGDADTIQLWFDFYDISNNVVATIGGTSGIDYNQDSDLIYSFKLSEIAKASSLYIQKGIAYKVKCRAKYNYVDVTDDSSEVIYRSSSFSSPITFTLTEPTISSITTSSSSSLDPSMNIANITVNYEPYYLYAPSGPSGIKFVFYDNDTGIEVARTIDYTFVNQSGSGSKSYSIKLGDIIPLGNLANGTYIVKAAVYVADHSGNAGGYVISSEGEFAVFDTASPVISSITPYDVQNDGGLDGIYEPSSTGDIDASDQIIATVSVKTAAYESYTSYVTNEIKFIFYDGSNNQVAETIPYAYQNYNSYSTSPSLHNIRLSDISGNTLLTNGTQYNVKAEVTLINSNNGTLVLYSSYKSAKFIQNIAPIPSVQISNTWALVTNNNPELYRANFLTSPDFGISGNFRKNAQFGSVYSRQLDTTSTKFKLEYQVLNSSGDLVTDWVTVKKAKLVLQGSSNSAETLETAANRALSIDYELSNVGEYNNIPGSGLGTSQGNIVFFIPQEQVDEITAFSETDRVNVRVTVIDKSTPSRWGGVTSSSHTSSSEPVRVIKKIDVYNFTDGAASEPWNSQYEAYSDISSNLLRVYVNGSIVTTDKSSVKADSNNIITELDKGWKIINTGVDTNGATGGKLPKVNLYFYGNTIATPSQTSSNSFSVNQISGMGAYAVIDQHPSAKEYPFFIAYTTPTASGNKASWYKSKLFYAPQSLGDTVDPTKVGPTLLYTGTDNTSFRPEIPSHRRVKYDLLSHDGVLTNANSNYASELVNLVSLQTSSNSSTSQAGNFNFTLSELGLITNSPVLSSLEMIFTKKLVLNIPVYWNSAYSYSAEVEYKYNNSGSYFAPVEFLKSSHPSTVSFVVDRTQAYLYYRVRYVVTNLNLGTIAKTNGIYTQKTVTNRDFPVSSDYTVSNTSYNTFNSNSSSSISFNLSFNANPEHRIDGVNVYFTSLNTYTSSTGSNISKVRIGSYTTANAGPKTITLLSATGGYLKVMDASGTIIVSTNYLWGNYDSANISFEAFRDARVNSLNAFYTPVSIVSNPVASGYYVESGSNDNFGSPSENPIWNVPTITRPSADGNILLSGGVINIVNNPLLYPHQISWSSVLDSNDVAFTYDIKVISDASGTIFPDQNNLTGNFAGNTYTIPIRLGTVDRYVIEIKKVFNSHVPTRRELSLADTIVFNSIKVETSGMAVSVENPSNTSSVTLLWNNPVISGNSVTGSQLSFANNISTQHIQYRIDASGNYAKLDVLGNNLIKEQSPKLYSLSSAIQPGTLLDFVAYVEANVSYTVNGVLSATNSVAYPLPLTPVTVSSKYIVSSIPSVTVPHSTPVLIQGSSRPTLLLNLNANGLESEGFISAVVILSQDGTASKPEGEQALLVFPDASNNLYPFSFPNSVTGISGDVPLDSRLVGGESATSTPRNMIPSVLSTQANNYKLTIGTVNTNTKRYGLSTLEMPSTINSGFVDSLPVNYMVILTTRRGTDIGVGEFTYKSIPSVSNVSITTTDGQYYVNFNLSPA